MIWIYWVWYDWIMKVGKLGIFFTGCLLEQNKHSICYENDI